MSSNRQCKTVLGSTGQCWVVLGSNGLDWAVLGCDGQYKVAHCLILDKKDQDQYLHWRIAPRGARGIQESEIIH